MFSKLLVSALIFSFMVTASWAGTITGSVTAFGKGKKLAAVHLVDVKGAITVPTEHATMVQKNQKYIPRVLPVVKGTTVDFPNKDTVFHNAFSLTPKATFDLGTYGPGKNPNTVFGDSGKVDIFCNMHEQMRGIILVLDHPFFTLTTKKGKFEIKDVPEGTYTIRAWVNPDKSKDMTVTVGPSETVTVDIGL
ncbi:MAG: hypothetical protein ACE5FY_04065 [Nitrospiria bacterium]